MKRTTFRRLILALGIFALVASVFSQVYENQTTEKFSKKVTTEKTDTQEEEVYVSVHSSSLPAAHVELNRDVYFLFETLFSEDNLDEAGVFHDVPLINLFEALIGSFISPNAP